MLISNTVLTQSSCRADIVRVGKAAIREQDHAAGALSVHVTRNRAAAGTSGVTQRLPGEADTAISASAQYPQDVLGVIEYLWHAIPEYV
jgi:hypothetical protein